MSAHGLRVAPLWRRLAAVMIDGVVIGTPMAGGGAVALFVHMKWGRGRDVGAWSPHKPSRWWRLVSVVASLAFDIRTGNRRSLGYRALGLRRVDVRTGGPVSIRSVLIRSAATATANQLIPLLRGPSEERRHELAAAHGEMDALQHAHAEDGEAMPNDFERHHAFTARSCLLPLAPMVLVNVWAVFSPLNQTLWDRLAGTVVVEE